jgi:hypothetical protein
MYVERLQAWSYAARELDIIEDKEVWKSDPHSECLDFQPPEARLISALSEVDPNEASSFTRL